MESYQWTRAFYVSCLLAEKQHHEPDDLICLSIEHQEPVTLKILRLLQNQPLSPMQKEVVLLLAQGFSNEKIGERLHIKVNTVKDYISTLFPTGY